MVYSTQTLQWYTYFRVSNILEAQKMAVTSIIPATKMNTIASTVLSIDFCVRYY